MVAKSEVCLGPLSGLNNQVFSPSGIILQNKCKLGSKLSSIFFFNGRQVLCSSYNLHIVNITFVKSIQVLLVLTYNHAFITKIKI